MKQNRKYFALAWLCMSLLGSGEIGAAPMAYTNNASFFADLGSASLIATTEDFEGSSAGDLLVDGGSVSGLTFSYDFGGVSLAVTDGDQFGGGGPFDTTSPSNFLGTDDSDLFQDGDDFSILFSASNAIGMFFLTADSMFDNDITLSAGGVLASLVAADVEQTLSDGSQVFFLGIIDDVGTFSSADISTVGLGAFLYNIDDIVTATVPEPGTAILVLFGLVGVCLRRQFL